MEVKVSAPSCFLLSRDDGCWKSVECENAVFHPPEEAISQADLAVPSGRTSNHVRVIS